MDNQWCFWKTAFGDHSYSPGPKCIPNNLKTSLQSVFSPSLLLSLLSRPPQLLPGILKYLLSAWVPCFHSCPFSECSPQGVPKAISLKHKSYHTILWLKILSCVFTGLRTELELPHGLPCPAPSQPILVPISPFPSLQPN